MSKFEEYKKDLLQEQKKWLVTGCAGFIGSHLLEFLLAHKQKVVGVDNFSTGKAKNLDLVRCNVGEDAWKLFSFTEGDITDLRTCERVVENVDHVLHQAALGSVPRSIKTPLLSHASNVDGFLNMLMAAKEAGVKSFVYASSSSVYGTNKDLPKLEANIGKPLSPYAVTKYTNELYGGVFHSVYGLNTVGLRYFNVFGPRQDPEGMYAAVIPLWVQSLIDGKTIFINGDGSTSRDFTYVANVIQLNICAALTKNTEAFGSVFNGALGDTISLNELFAKIKENVLLKLPDLQSTDPTYRDFRVGDILNSQADISKAKKLLGYDPKVKVEDGLKMTVDFFVNSYSKS
jgi:UDP-N-acetylglucosamine 4-epimerase